MIFLLQVNWIFITCSNVLISKNVTKPLQILFVNSVVFYGFITYPAFKHNMCPEAALGSNIYLRLLIIIPIWYVIYPWYVIQCMPGFNNIYYNMVIL